MSIVRKNALISPEDYLDGENYSDAKHEYVYGQVYAMVGSSSAHNLIAGNLFVALHAHLRGSACRVYMSDMKVRIGDIFYYPDVMVACDRSEREQYYRERPCLIMEVLSASTERLDTMEKRLTYQSAASLTEYVLVAQDKIEVKVYRRIEDGWELEICGEADQLNLKSVDLAIPIQAIFEDVWD